MICFKFSLKEKVRGKGGRKLLKGAGKRGADVTYTCQFVCSFLFFTIGVIHEDQHNFNLISESRTDFIFP